ncbi:uncharacterized protein LOC115885007 [Sitophilus oryzae]|uniref:Uncharacterized protein LOC115885007 n=1 Tax=Sitophilus oryzae TaxID=7048 RepID=A0A6J2Y8V1_SITOR|nr:uncharacterized protein LOC115885007 [Sitophilus oryzae]
MRSFENSYVNISSLGLLGNFLIRGKIILQDIWRSGIDWDQKISNEIEKKWKKWLENLEQMYKLRIPRCYCLAACYTVQLHMFSDASGKAFGGVGYFRFEYNNGIQVSLVMSKTQVAPLKPISILRLELQAALVSCRLAETIKKKHSIKIDSTHFWTDSQIVLSWIKSEARILGTFIANRVGEIQEKTSTKNWHWISTKLNVTDEATRDEETLKLNLNERWHKGPDFLYLQDVDWNSLNLAQKCESISESGENEKLILVNQKVSLDFLPDMRKFSFWTKVIRSTAIIYVFIDFRIAKRRQDQTKISRQDIEKEESLWIRKIQTDNFQKEILDLETKNIVNSQSALYQLTPTVKNGLICMNGRINKAVELPEETKNPIILSNKHLATKLLILMYHRRTGHGGVGITLNEIRQKFWILQARKTIKNVIRNCALCAIRKAKPRIPQMGQIPEFRLEKPMTQRPFTYTGIDMFGPYNVSIGRRRERRYGMLFTCLSVRAIHIELTETLNTDSTLLALRRFISRRAQPKMILCDNGGNFHSAAKELKSALKEIDYDKIERHLLAEEIEWRFIPPASPHIGGAWERMVKSVKSALKISLREQSPRPEVLETLMCEAEHIVNSRPLTYVSSSAEDPLSITPNHFLIGSSSIVKPPGLFIDQDWNIRKQWRISQKITEHFWTRWIKEYIPTLTKRTKWFQENKNLKIGDLVILMDDKFPKNNWPLGRVEKVYPGHDGKVRVADIKTKTGTYCRPLTKICIVECLEMGED